jgi:long-chain acyl-CoA synthetase
MTGLISEGEQLVAQGKDRYSGIEIDRERTCAVLFTSGTTGKSKGVMLTHHNLASDISAISEIVDLKPEDVFLCLLPVHHSMITMSSILAPMAFGVTIAFCDGIKTLAAGLKLFKPTAMVLVPLVLETFLKKIWESARKQGKGKALRFAIGLCNVLAAVGINVRRKLLANVLEYFGGKLQFVFCGGAPLSPKVVKGFLDFGIKLYHGYGTTECSPLVTANSDRHFRPGSDGYPVSCCELRISDSGEILIKGDIVMKGYLDDEQATAEVFDGVWYKSGDLGYIEDGFLYVNGRCKNLIVLKNGKNINPEEIEYKLSAIAGVAEVMVEEEPGNEYLTAQIYPDQEALKSLGEEALKKAINDEIDKVNQTLEPYKRVRRFELRRTEFPKTTKRTIIRHQVKGGQ